ncbi:hypothetical protein [Myceligenerans indicum]|uniref:HEAT repeat domain-containing protein n=1 Tax=Myceligenerans indicum TaxID=2593663 RepID=A0ABS1LH96_9MICO|nr:hypothetical protein [Myceligenerans indicum]MBL0884957.1 hypothetical protein [Myceligenerans indicum]
MVAQVDPLAGLNEVEWEWLVHAYGAAKDVPANLRALRSRDAQVRHAALIHLGSSVTHQGSRYSASAPVARFVAELVLAPETLDRERLLDFLCALAVGIDNDRLPTGVPIAEWRDEAAQVEAEREALIAGATEWADSEMKRGRERELWLRNPFSGLATSPDTIAAYDAARDALPRLGRLLGSHRSVERARVAYLIGMFPESAARTVPLIAERLDVETDEHALTAVLIAHGLLAGPSATLARAARFLDDQRPLVRWGAATALARASAADSRSPGRPTIDILIESTVHPDVPDLRIHDGWIGSYAAKSLASIRHWLTAADIRNLADRLPLTASSFNRDHLLDAILSSAFPGADHAANITLDRLKPVQQHVLGAVLPIWKSDDSWMSTIPGALARHGLTCSRSEIEAALTTGGTA